MLRDFGNMPRHKGPTARPMLCVCYLCGQQFGTASIGIHIPQCYKKHLLRWKSADPFTRGKQPLSPKNAGATLSFKTGNMSPRSLEEYNEAQYREFTKSLEPCPNCGRKFFPDRLVVHLRSCKSPVIPSNKQISSKVAKSSVPLVSSNDIPNVTQKLENSRKKNPQLICTGCKKITDNLEAQFCQACGKPLELFVKDENSGELCQKCREVLPQNAHFCPNCGGPAASSSSVPHSSPTLPQISLSSTNRENPTFSASRNFRKSMNVEQKQLIGDSSIGGEKNGVISNGKGSRTVSGKEIKQGGTSDNALDLSGSSQLYPKTTKKSSTTSTMAKSVEFRDKNQVSMGKSETGFSFGNTSQGKEFGDENELENALPRVSCSNCGRLFASDIIQRHNVICQRQKTRKVFNSTLKRIAGTGAESLYHPEIATRIEKQRVKPSKWREESLAFRKALREARTVDKIIKSGGDLRNLPPPTYSDNSHLVPCPYCTRRFAPDVAERHIPHCANTINRPKPPPKAPRLSKSSKGFR